MNTLDRYVADYMRSRRSLGIYGPKSQRVVGPRLMTISRFHGGRPLSSLTPQAIERWLGSLDHLAVNSRASYLVSVRQFTAWLHSEGHIASDPCAGIPAVKRARPIPRALPALQVRDILAACSDDRDRALVWLGVGCGLRRSEIANLRWEHVDERSGILEVHNSKNGGSRVLPLIAEVAAALRPLRGGGATGPVVRSVRDPHSGISAEWVGAKLAKIMRAAGVKRRAYDGVSAHALRHTCASDVLDNSKDLRAVQQLLGHQHLSTTAGYLRRVDGAALLEAMSGRAYGGDAA